MRSGGLPSSERSEKLVGALRVLGELLGCAAVVVHSGRVGTGTHKSPNGRRVLLVNGGEQRSATAAVPSFEGKPKAKHQLGALLGPDLRDAVNEGVPIDGIDDVWVRSSIEQPTQPRHARAHLVDAHEEGRVPRWVGICAGVEEDLDKSSRSVSDSIPIGRFCEYRPRRAIVWVIGGVRVGAVVEQRSDERYVVTCNRVEEFVERSTCIGHS